jgi:hypothetical protein
VTARHDMTFGDHRGFPPPYSKQENNHRALSRIPARIQHASTVRVFGPEVIVREGTLLRNMPPPSSGSEHLIVQKL